MMSDKQSEGESGKSDILPTAGNFAGELIKAASHNPSVKAAGAELGKAAHTIAKTINVALLPLAAVNFGYEKAREYFETRFSRDMEEKLSRVAEDQIISPKPSVVGYALQGLAFAHDETTLREMYLHLLASAMDSRSASTVHPAFAEVIRQLSPEEAPVLCAKLTSEQPAPIVQLRLQYLPVGAGWRLLANHLMEAIDPATRQPVEIQNLTAMIDNWIRLGLVEVSYSQTVASDKYAWIESQPEYLRLKELHGRPPASTPDVPSPPPPVVGVHKGTLTITAFGELFSKSVGMEEIQRRGSGGESRSDGFKWPDTFGR
jgi:hypothetical protein